MEHTANDVSILTETKVCLLQKNYHCDVNELLLVTLQSIDCCVHSAFDNKARHMSLFLLADPEDSAERLLFNLDQTH